MLTVYHAPKSRASRILWLLEELGQPYDVKPVDIRRRDGSGGPDAAYRAVHPHAKVPALVHDGHTIIESAAICLYVSDAFPDAKLGPPVGSPDRASFVTWLFYAAADVEPGLMGRALKWADLDTSIASPEEAMAHVQATLEAHDYVIGNTFTVADIMICSILQFMAMMKAPSNPTFDAYMKRCMARPAFARAMAKDSYSPTVG